jgi:hypothetical protein
LFQLCTHEKLPFKTVPSPSSQLVAVTVPESVKLGAVPLLSPVKENEPLTRQLPLSLTATPNTGSIPEFFNVFFTLSMRGLISFNASFNPIAGVAPVASTIERESVDVTEVATVGSAFAAFRTMALAGTVAIPLVPVLPLLSSLLLQPVVSSKPENSAVEMPEIINLFILCSMII